MSKTTAALFIILASMLLGQAMTTLAIGEFALAQSRFWACIWMLFYLRDTKPLRGYREGK